MEASTHILLFILGGIVIFAIYIIAPSFINTRPNYKNNYKYKDKYKDKDAFYLEQQERVSLGGYKVKQLLNKTEQTARKAIWRTIFNANKDKEMDLLAQVSLGEILKHQNEQLYNDINSKRVDFVIIDKTSYLPIAIVEIHGQGHYSETATKRDIIKRSAIESAGLEYIAIAVGNNDAEIAATVEKKIGDFCANHSKDSTTT